MSDLRFETHDVFNQPPPYEDINLFATDTPLGEAVAANGVGAEAGALSDFGRHWGRAEMFELARLANTEVPKLRTYDARGFRRDVVDYHPAYHQFMSESLAAGLQAMTWKPDATRAPAPGEVLRAARYYMVAQVENGHMCPVTMTRAAVTALAEQPDLLAKFMPKVMAREYDQSFRPWWQKSSVTLGMGMTEKQGGTDVRANSSVAAPADGGYLITGHKWFMSAPMCDAFLVLAQAPGGLTCFLMPRFRPDGSVNALRFQRLKDKLGNRSNASAEVEFAEAFAFRVGEEGRGVATIIEMVQLTRLDCAIASAGMMRMALARTIHHARHRTVFQKRLIEQPMMRSVLADLALDVEAATALVVRLARAFDRSFTDPGEAVYARLMTPAIKFWVCKTAPAFIYEAMECLGGNGYVEDDILARLYREAPVNAIWEGSGNVMCLDVLRALGREGSAARALLNRLAAEVLELPGGLEANSLVKDTLGGADAEARARIAVEKLALVGAASALAARGPRPVADAFARTRLAERAGPIYGATQLTAAEIDLLIERALPARAGP